MIIDKKVLDELTEKAKASPRLRCNLDLRNSAEDQSQRMLNALEPGTIMPIHRHKGFSETCVCIRGHFEEYFYDDIAKIRFVLNEEQVDGNSLYIVDTEATLAYKKLSTDGDEKTIYKLRDLSDDQFNTALIDHII